MNTKKALAKLDIIRAWHNFLDKYREMENYVTVEIQYLFCRLYNQHQLAIAPLTTETYSVVARISRAQLCRDLARYNNDGIDALGITWGGRRKSGTEIEINPDLKAAIDKYIAYGCTKFGPAKILKLLKTQEDFDKLPSVCQIRSYLGKFKRENPMVWLELASKDQAKNHYGIAYGKYKTDFPNQVWELDGSPDDILLNIDGVARRYQALFLIDRCTRDLTIDIAESENSTATKKLLRKAIASRGIPDKIVTDNGSGFKAEKTQSMIERLKIELEFCPPGRPEKKPFVERVIRTFQDALRVLPGYIGKNTKERADLRSNERGDCDGLLTLDQFKEWCDRWVKQYRAEFHHGLDCSPVEKIAQATKDGWNPLFIPDNRVLDFLLLEDKSRKVGKQGIRLNNRFYIAPELGGLMGQDVQVCWDIESADKIYVYRDDLLSEYICTAHWAEGEDIDVAAVSKQAKEIKKEVISQAKELQKEAKKVVKKIEKDPLSVLDKGTVEPLVQKVETTNEDLQRLADAVTGAFDIKPQTIDELAMKRRENANAATNATRPTDDPGRLRELVNKINGGDLLTPDEQFWFDRYVETPSGAILIGLLRKNTG